ncbi:clathrin heavy chain linker domain-containing protein 1-like isoform X2 [Mercenaria mercenaria]|uniref:clathrin heavy chain linker domain-containing protein 1-like isoform X2 n=1 Tax=Mercenaria mercenaria TaxID=6596 RepID=UPI00234F30EA|nr:clathrin heavy chain linker domain-containing protein 1-like isoform X2 [Mercenaria mercenaria]
MIIMSGTGSGYSTPVSGFMKLPPIVTSESDREFLRVLNEYIELELGKVNPDDDEQRYIVYKTAFNKIIEHVTAYQPLLTTIKKEYEETIEAIKKAQREATFLHGKLKAMASEPSTIRNYRKRGDELEERVNIVKKDNERLHNQLIELKVRRMEKEKKEKEITEPPKREMKKDHRLIPGLTLEESTDKQLLQTKLEELDRQLKELTISFKTRYVPKTRKIELKESLDNKVAHRDMLLRQGQFYKAKRQRLKVASEAAQAYNREKPPHQTVGDTVMMALQYAAMQARKQKEAEVAAENQNQSEGMGPQREGSGFGEGPSTTSTFEDDDPNKEKEAEMMLEYIEKFNELFEDGKYEEAAIHAANSPKGILRTSATLAKFRDVKVRINGRTPLLMFCDALMPSAGSENARPDARLSLECVECALYENRLDLLSHWVAQKRLTFTEEMGHMIHNHCKCQIPCRCSAQAMAQNVFIKLKMYKEAIVCLLKQGRVRAGLDLARQRCDFTKEDYIDLLRSSPSIQLLHALVDRDNRGERPLSIGCVIMNLMEENKFELALPFIQEMQHKPSKDEPHTSAFHAAVLDDHETSVHDWNELVHILQDQGYGETAMGLLAAITVLQAMKNAIRTSQEEFHNLAQSENTDVLF